MANLLPVGGFVNGHCAIDTARRGCLAFLWLSERRPDMAEAQRSPDEIITLPEGGGAQRGIGETFAADLQTGTGNVTIPIAVPTGRVGMQPKLDLVYSTGNGNGPFGLGWSLSIPGVTRKTSHGVPTYHDDEDTFILSGSEDLVPVETLPQGVRYRPRTEGLFALIIHVTGPAGQDYWQVTSRDGLISRYGTPRPAEAEDGWGDPATVDCPSRQGTPRVFAWALTETRDLLGNVIVYEYGKDEGVTDEHRWRQPWLEAIKYADYTADGGTTRFLATVTLDAESRTDAFSSYTAGFEIRTTRRYRAITTAVHPGSRQPVRRYEFTYEQDPHDGVSLLTGVGMVGFDDAGAEHRDLPAVTLGYSRFEPARRRLHPVTGPEPPSVGLSSADHELVDLTGDGLPDVLQLDGVARYWRNLGGGVFDRPRPMATMPAGYHLGDPGVQLLDADGDGRADLLVTIPGVAGYFPLRFGPAWGDFVRYREAPSFDLKDPAVRLLDLDGDGVTDAVRGGDRLECFFSNSRTGWAEARPASCEGADGLPALNLADPRVRWADMSGDGLTDLVVIHDRCVEYWPNLGHGRFGGRVRMAEGPDLPREYLPERLLLGDVDGDGLADLVYVDADQVMVWFNRSGNSWSPPVVVRGAVSDLWDVRITDLLGTGVGGILWSRAAPGAGRPSMYFLDLPGGVKPRLLTAVDNHLGAVTRVRYRPSTAYAARDHANPRTRWRTTLPFVVPVVAKVESIDRISGGKLTSEYSYRHGYWDGVEREFRGFGCVEQTDTETIADYHQDGLHPGTPFTPVAKTSFCPPTLTRTWFHIGPVDSDADGTWAALNPAEEYWPGDRPLLEGDEDTKAFVRTLRDARGLHDRRASRHALRALRGRILRVELYGLDPPGLDPSSQPDADRSPYTVTEYAYGLREENTRGDPRRPRAFFPYETRRRVTQWERGRDPMTHDPMTQFTFTGDHDAFGQPQRQTTVTPPRRSLLRRPVTAAVVGTVAADETTVLATHVRTDYATHIPVGVHVHDRVAQVRTYELQTPPTVDEQDRTKIRAVLADQWITAKAVDKTFQALRHSDVSLIGDIVHHYDGGAFLGLPAGELGQHGLLTRTESLVFTADLLDHAYGALRPDFLGGADPRPDGAPADFGAGLGYHPGGDAPLQAADWYTDTVRRAHDVQLSTAAHPLPQRGLVVGVQDPFGHETRITPDSYWLLAAVVKDPVGVQTAAVYNYRTGQPHRVVDANGNATNYRYHPLGLLAAAFVESRDGTSGGTEASPDIRYTHDLGAFPSRGQPISVHTSRRVWHARGANSDEVIDTREYSDGFGRLLQTRAQADDLAFGDNGDDAGLLVPDSAGVLQPLPGQADGPATGIREAERVVVSGWEVHDNKGRTVRKYEPFFDTGWDYQPEADARRGRPVRTFYDPRGRPIRILNPDGSQRRTIFGTPTDLTRPDELDPTPPLGRPPSTTRTTSPRSATTTREHSWPAARPQITITPRPPPSSMVSDASSAGSSDLAPTRSPTGTPPGQATTRAATPSPSTTNSAAPRFTTPMTC